MWYACRALVTDAAPHTTATDDDWLLSALAEGDPEALRQVYRHHHEAVRAFAYRLTGAEADAEELVQETFLALPQAVRGFRKQCSLRTFLIGVAVNHARHAVRSATRRRAAMARFAAEPQRAPAAPDHAFDQAQLAQVLTRALDLLPLDQRVAFVLCEVEERTSTEASTIIGASDSTVRARVRLAKQRLRMALAEEGVR